MQNKPHGTWLGRTIKSTLIAAVLVVAYPASIVPARWVQSRFGYDGFFVIYEPFNWAFLRCRPLRKVTIGYLELCGYGSPCGRYKYDDDDEPEHQNDFWSETLPDIAVSCVIAWIEYYFPAIGNLIN
jgi:hypothetical protein